LKAILDKLNRFFRGGWQIAVLDLIKGRWILKPDPLCIPYLKAENANGRHILMRSDPETAPHYLMADDLNMLQIAKHHRGSTGKWKPGRLVVETSPSNFQVWIRSGRPVSLTEKRFWLKKLGSDPAADPNHRWGRCPGFRNRKEKYRGPHGGYPLARLIWIDWKQTAYIPPAGKGSNSLYLPPLSPQPGGGVCRSHFISRANYEKGNESSTDFAYVLALARRGFSDNDIEACIISERKNWKNHHGTGRMNSYLQRTIKKAKLIVQNS